MTKREQPRGRCCFCGREGVTKEHVFGKSLTKLFDGQGGSGNKHVVRHSYTHPDGSRTPVKRASTFAVVSRKVCRSCNGGWMREADEAVFPTLRAFAREEPIVLSPAEQARLSFWATKTILALATVKPSDLKLVPAGCHRRLFETGEALQGSQVWLGANTHGDLVWAGSHSLRFDEEVLREAGYGSTLSFGWAVLHLMVHGLDDRLLELEYMPRRALTQVCPTSPEVSWPPSVRFDMFDLTPLAQEINDNAHWEPRPAT